MTFHQTRDGYWRQVVPDEPAAETLFERRQMLTQFGTGRWEEGEFRVKRPMSTREYGFTPGQQVIVHLPDTPAHQMHQGVFQELRDGWLVVHVPKMGTWKLQPRDVYQPERDGRIDRVKVS